MQQNKDMTLSITHETYIHQTLLWQNRSWGPTLQQCRLTIPMHWRLLIGLCHFSKAFLCILDQVVFFFSATKKRWHKFQPQFYAYNFTLKKWWPSMRVYCIYCNILYLLYILNDLHLTVGGPVHVSSLNNKNNTSLRQLELKENI